MVELNEDEKVSIIILCNNSKRWLDKCIDSVMDTDYRNFEVILVDNASTDGSVDEIEQKYNGITVIKNSENYGWCKANNIGIKHAFENGSDYVYLSNSDVVFFKKDWLKELVFFMQTHREYKITGPLQYKYDNNLELNEWSKYILWNGNRDGNFMWSKYISSSNRKYNYTLDNVDDNHLDVPFVQGAAMLVNRNAFYQVGYFDELFFIFYDEVDFCRRNLRIGNRVALVPSSKVAHYGSGDVTSSSKKQRKRNYYFSRNKYYYVLSDYNLSKKVKRNIINNWILWDIRQSVMRNSDISDPIQLIQIYIELLRNKHKYLHKKKCELENEKKIIYNKLLQQVTGISLYNNLANDNAKIDLEKKNTLLHYIEKEFGVAFYEEPVKEDAINIDWLTNYIAHYDLWKRNI